MSNESLLADLRSFCRQQFCERESLTVTDLEQINTGWECDVYSFTLGWSQQDQPHQAELILRMYTDETDEQLIPEKHRREFEVIRQLGLAGYPVPQVLAIDDGDWLHRPAIVMQRIAGAPMRQVYRQTAPLSQPAVISTFVRLFRQLHQLDGRPFACLLAVDPGAEPVQHSLQMLQGYLFKTRSTEFDQALSWLTERATRVPAGHNCLVHWDYHPDNVLVRSTDQQPFVIDWTAVDIADYRFDLAWSRLLMGEQLGELMLAEYVRQTDHPLVDFDFFLAFACLRRMFVMTTAIRQGATVLGMRAAATAVIRRDHQHLQDVYRMFQGLTGLALPAVETLIAELRQA